jgi:hypothetical protein
MGRNKRKGGGKSALATVSKAGPQTGAKPTQPPPKKDPNLQVAALQDFAYGTIATQDIPGTIRALVTRDGDGAIVYNPKLDTIDKPQKYTINIHVEEGTAHKKSAAKQLTFEILKLDPKLTVGALPDFDYDPKADLPTTINALIKKVSPVEPTFEPDLATVGKPASYSIKITLAPDDHYKGADATLTFNILKLTPSLTVGKLDDFKPESKVPAKAIKDVVKVVKGDEKLLTFEPALPQKALEKSGIYSYKIYLAEDDYYKKSDDPDPVLTFRILMPVNEVSNAFMDFKKGKDQQVLNKLEEKKTRGRVFELVTQGKFGSPAEVVNTLNSILGPPDRHTVWGALGYTLSSGGWTMAENFKTTSGITFHFTVSADSITVPAARTGWTATPAALFDTLFLGPAVPMRVHMTLEIAPTRRHAFLGNAGQGLNGNGNPLPNNPDNQDMIAELDNFRNRMIAKITKFKTDFGLD